MSDEILERPPNIDETHMDKNGVEYYEYGGKWNIVEEQALGWLLSEEHCFINERNYCHFEWKDKPDGRTTVIFVNTSDIFAWACADGEDLENDQIPILYELIRDKGGFWGIVRWVCLLRNEKPQYAVARDMYKAGYWDEEMNNLNTNRYSGRYELETA